MKNSWLVLSTGFALFSMFFGSGNLVFPIAVGTECGGHYLLSAMGILLTGVVVPFLGVFGMLLYKGDLNNFFSYLGKPGIFLFSLLALSIMGPFGVLARCLTVAHGAISLIYASAPLVWTSLYLCLVIFLLAVNKSRILSTLGIILTPFLLLSIGAITFFGLQQGAPSPQIEIGSFQAFKDGFFQGYQTMDLLAAFFFSTFVIQQLRKQAERPYNHFVKASCIGGGILALVYFSLVLLGWIFAPKLVGYQPPEMLGKIAMESLGVWAIPAVATAVVFACLTTAIVLVTLFADFLRKEVLREKIGNIPALLITLLIGFLVSTLEFQGIAKFIGPILEFIYPVLIALTCLNIVRHFWFKPKLAVQ